MAENIVELLTDVADAIREKKGSNEPINAQNFANEIKNLPSGGGGVPSEVKDSIGNGIQNITSLSFADSVTEIGDLAYRYCRQLKEVVFNEGITTLGKNAFDYCVSLESINLPTTIATIGEQCFAHLSGLMSLTFPSDAPLTRISNNMLWGSPLLQKLVMPRNINFIDGYSFEGCSALEYIDFSLLTKVPTLASTTAFSGTTKAKIIVPDALYENWIAETNWASLADRIVKNSEYTRPL